jgi:hypothetical protein
MIVFSKTTEDSKGNYHVFACNSHACDLAKTRHSLDLLCAFVRVALRLGLIVLLVHGLADPIWEET